MDGRLLLQVGFPVLAAIAVSFGITELKGETHARLRYKRERRREQWELENFAKGEKQEMVELYVQRGMKEEDAEIVISKMAKYEQFFVDIMMMEGEYRHAFSNGPLLLFISALHKQSWACLSPIPMFLLSALAL